MPVYQLRIKLRGMSPPVWRRIVIDAEASLANLHEVIQRSMGWEDDHQHRFMIRGRCFNLPQPGGVYYGGAQLKLSAFGFRAHERFVYEYDFCSHWVHDVRIERLLDACDGAQCLPRCLAGAGACPQEGLGPPQRFMNELDQHGECDFYEWLEERFPRLQQELDVEDFRDELEAWRPWVERSFDRKAANVRLQNLEVSR
jgi:hypothetical protein